MDTFEQDPELASELRQGAGREIIEEAAEDERLTALHDRRRFGLSELAKDMANKGERVSVEYGGHAFSGAVVSAGADYVVIEGSGQRVEARLDSGYWTVIPASGATFAGTTTTESLVARLAEHAEKEHLVRLAIPEGLLVIGKVSVVADDHVEVIDADQRRLYVPTNLILAIIRSVEFQ